MEVTRIAGVSYVGGIFVRSELTAAFTATGTITFDWGKLSKPEFTKLCSAIEQGFALTGTGVVKALLDLVTNLDAAPDVPPIGYMGKKNMNVVVPRSKAEQYKTDLIAAGHMVDLNLSSAVGIRDCGYGPDYVWLNVSGWYVQHHVKDGEAPASRNRWRNSGGHLKPATSKLANLVRLWQEELLPERKPLLDWVKQRPVLTFNLYTGLDK